MEFDFNNKTTLGHIKLLMLKGERGKTGHGPYAVSKAAEMADLQQIYVYTGDETGYTFAHWYFWNGSAWEDGGEYNAAVPEIDKTLTEANKTAEAKATGHAIKGADLPVADVSAWEKGTIQASDGVPVSNSSRIRTTTFKPLADISRFTIQPGYQAAIYVYSDQDGTEYKK